MAFLPAETRLLADCSAIAAFLTSPLGRRLLAADTVEREREFIFAAPAGQLSEAWAGMESEVVVQGIIDCYFTEKEKTVLIDWKTDHLYGPEGVERAREKYAKQVELYALALKKAFGVEVSEAYIALLSTGTLINAMSFV